VTKDKVLYSYADCITATMGDACIITGAAESEPPLDGLRHNTKYEFTWDIVMIIRSHKQKLIEARKFSYFFI
jgi:hypothetical protein